jgi:isocitrate dehydrogenase kinase/phosphatase
MTSRQLLSRGDMAMQTSDNLVVEPKPVQLDPAQVAQMILAGFDRHYALFRYGAQRAKSLFESGDWLGIQKLSRERIEYYDRRVRECLSKLNPVLARQAGSQDPVMSDEQRQFWQAVRQSYVALLGDHQQPECAETFYNSVTCRALHRDYFHNDFLFVRPAVATDYLDSKRPVYRVYYPAAQGLTRSLTQMLADFGLACGFDNLPRDVRLLARAGVRELTKRIERTSGHRLASDCQLHVLGSLFFRNKTAYVVGRLINEGSLYPFVIPLVRNVAGQVEVDALLADEADLSTIFSFTRAYFLVDMEVPAAYVEFVASLIPRKAKAEIYTMVGLQKQGKTLFYRDFLQHLAHSHDQFDLAPGIPGLVMSVFTLPSYPYVFKLIKDKISKDGMTPATVRAKYQMVKLHDRIGRMADTWEYSQVALPRARFSEALIAELERVAPTQIEQRGDLLVLKHLYIERRMTPLNLYLVDAPQAMRYRAIHEYGEAIRELAAANIFPGDMLYKNFGVTRLGRVVFYDYDEIQPMTEMNFRAIPPAPNEEAEMASEPWYAIGPNDVFPEEFSTFLLGNVEIRKVFRESHTDLLEPQWWQNCREQVARGVLQDPRPYADDRRLREPTDSLP